MSGPVRSLQEAAAKNDNAAMGTAAIDLHAKADTAASKAQAYGLVQCGSALKPAMANLFDGAKSVVKSAYVAKGETLCRDAAKKTGALTAPTSSLASLSRYTDSYLPIVTKLTADIKAITVPPGVEATVKDFVDTMEGSQPKIKEIGAAAKANNVTLVGALFEELDLLDTQMNAKLDAYGLKLCGSLGDI